MAKSQRVYTPEFRRQMVELHRAGRSFDELAKEFGCTSWSIRQWVKQADRDTGRGDGGLSTAERQELLRLRRETAASRMERDILSKAVAGFAGPARQTLAAASSRRRWRRLGPSRGGGAPRRFSKSASARGRKDARCLRTDPSLPVRWRLAGLFAPNFISRRPAFRRRPAKRCAAGGIGRGSRGIAHVDRRALPCQRPRVRPASMMLDSRGWVRMAGSSNQ